VTLSPTEAGQHLSRWSRTSRAAPWFAGLFPLAYYIAGASAEPGLGDEGGHIAAAIGLMPVQAPGSPLATLAGAFATLLPVGPLSFRVSLGSALCAGVVLALFTRTVDHTLQALLGAHRSSAPLWALAAAMGLAQSPLFCAQALRPQPFTAHYVVFVATLWALLRFERRAPAGDRRMLYVAMFLHGLAFANHHALALLLFGATLPTLGRLFAWRGFAGIMGLAAAALVGFTANSFVPIRMGEAQSALATRSVLLRVSAYLKHAAFSEPVWPREHGVIRTLWGGLVGGSTWLGVLVLFALVLGVLRYAVAARTRRFVLLWLLVLTLPLLGLFFALPPLSEADTFGVLVPSAMAVFTLGVAGLAGSLQHLAFFAPTWGRAVATGCALFWGVSVARTTIDRASGPGGVFDARDDTERRRLPSRSAVLMGEPDTYFHWLGAEAEEVLRTDLIAVPLFRTAPPGFQQALSRREPALAAYLTVRKILSIDELSTLRDAFHDRALMVEPRVVQPSAATCAATIPRGRFLEVLGVAASPLQRKVAVASLTRQLVRLWRTLDTAPGRDAQAIRDRVHRELLYHAACAASVGEAQSTIDLHALVRLYTKESAP
jgi:hypothetical protein